LTAGKLLHDFEHKGAVTSLEFHPHEFLLASSSEDRTLKYWDLETFDMISTSDVESNYVQNFAFSVDGSCLFGAYSDSLKVWGWEPPKVYDQININWKEVGDIYITDDQLVCCTINTSNIGIWMVNPQVNITYIFILTFKIEIITVI
jgi:katanin p80 WD40 repeat-containing subunit B1